MKSSMENPLLAVQLIPKPQWGINLRNQITRDEWQKIREIVLTRANFKCEICSSKTWRSRLHVHEEWEYHITMKADIQKLSDLVAICEDCHAVVHFGRTTVMGQQEKAYEHLMRVNQWDRAQAEAHVNEAFENWQIQSRTSWTLDIELAKKYLEQK